MFIPFFFFQMIYQFKKPRRILEEKQKVILFLSPKKNPQNQKQSWFNKTIEGLKDCVEDYRFSSARKTKHRKRSSKVIKNIHIDPPEEENEPGSQTTFKESIKNSMLIAIH